MGPSGPARPSLGENVVGLRTLELLAAQVYGEAAEYLRQNEGLAESLSRLARDEERHTSLLAEVGGKLALRGEPESGVAADPAARARREEPFRICLATMREGTAGAGSLVVCFLETESCDWNDVFLYVLHRVRDDERSFLRVAATLDAHGERARTLFSTRPEGSRLRTGVIAVPRVGGHRFLVVEDDDALRDVFGRILGKRGAVETASNGREGLDKITQRLYSAVVSEVGMPEMSGLEMYRRAVAADHTLAPHLVFCTAGTGPEAEGYVRQQGLEYLAKPTR